MNQEQIHKIQIHPNVSGIHNFVLLTRNDVTFLLIRDIFSSVLDDCNETTPINHIYIVIF